MTVRTAHDFIDDLARRGLAYGRAFIEEMSDEDAAALWRYYADEESALVDAVRVVAAYGNRLRCDSRHRRWIDEAGL